MSALANHSVGQYLNRHYVSAFQRVAKFQINWGQKQGGNVAGYFCTPEGRVLHAIAGPVDAHTFLREARWANETYQMAQLEKRSGADLSAFFRRAHIKRLQSEVRIRVSEAQLPRVNAATPRFLKRVLAQNAHLGLSNQGKMHLLLTVAPTPRLSEVYSIVFERILNEQISTDPVNVAGQ